MINISEFLKTAKGRVIWLDIVTQNDPFTGKLEDYDEEHLVISGEGGLDCVRIDQIAVISLPIQAEIV
jgi:hypothetical protein